VAELKEVKNLTLNNVKELRGNDIYFFEILEDKLLINDNYEGVLIFDSEFNLLKKIKLLNDLMIESSIKKENKILLICPENGKIIYINLTNYQYKIISLSGFEDWTFSSLFDWEENIIILSDYNGNFVKLDLESSKIIIVDKYCSIQKIYQKLEGKGARKIFALEKKAILENDSNNLELIDYADSIICLAKLPKEQFHDFEITSKYIAEIGEYGTLIMNFENGNRQQYFPQKEYYFLRGKFMGIRQENFFFLLSGNKSDECRTLIEQYLL
jgi:hypothetical protein